MEWTFQLILLHRFPLNVEVQSHNALSTADNGGIIFPAIPCGVRFSSGLARCGSVPSRMWNHAFPNRKHIVSVLVYFPRHNGDFPGTNRSFSAMFTVRK